MSGEATSDDDSSERIEMINGEMIVFNHKDKSSGRCVFSSIPMRELQMYYLMQNVGDGEERNRQGVRGAIVRAREGIKRHLP